MDNQLFLEIQNLVRKSRQSDLSPSMKDNIQMEFTKRLIALIQKMHSEKVSIELQREILNQAFLIDQT